MLSSNCKCLSSELARCLSISISVCISRQDVRNLFRVKSNQWIRTLAFLLAPEVFSVHVLFQSVSLRPAQLILFICFLMWKRKRSLPNSLPKNSIRVKEKKKGIRFFTFFSPHCSKLENVITDYEQQAVFDGFVRNYLPWRSVFFSLVSVIRS